MRLGSVLADLVADLRFACRTFDRNRGFALAAILSLAIGIGAVAATFSVVNALLLRPVPYADADRLVILWNRSPGLGIAEDWFSTAQYFDIKNGHAGFEQLAIAVGGTANLTGSGDPERVGLARVSSSLLPMLGGTAAHGRLFASADDLPGRPVTAILSHGMWARRYDSDPGVVGRTLTLNGVPVEVVGVLPASFALPQEVVPILYGGEVTDLYLPLQLSEAAPRTRDREDFNIVGKLKRGVSAAEAQAGLDVIAAGLRRDHPEVYPPNGRLTFSVLPLLEQAVGGVRLRLYVLLGAVGFVLLVACANVANLLLARAIARRREFALRAALGAGRSRIVRQLLVESAVLSLSGGALGVLLCQWGLEAVRVVGPKTIPRMGEIAVDLRVLGFALLASLASGLAFGLVPALRLSRVSLADALRHAGRGLAEAAFGRRQGLNRLLVSAELALSMLLLVGAGLLVRSLVNLQAIHPGFNPRGVLSCALQMSGPRYDGPLPVLAAYERIWGRLDALPGAVASGGVSPLPLSDSPAWTPITIEGRTPPRGEQFINADERIVAGRYFQAMEIPLRRGRFFGPHDTADDPGVVIVDERLAREYWPGQDAVGKRLRRGGTSSTSPWLTVVGVVGRVKHQSLDDDPRIAFYLPHAQRPTRGLSVVVRTSGDPKALAGPLQQAIRDVDPALPVYSLRTMEAYLAQSVARQRFTAWLLAVFAALALAVAAVGTYGVMSYLVSQSARDIGVRMALGATRRRVVGTVFGLGITLAAAGIGAGLLGAFALSRFLVSLLYGVSAHDPVVLGSVSATLLLVALLAAYVPARRAAAVDPVVSLRCE